MIRAFEIAAALDLRFKTPDQRRECAPSTSLRAVWCLLYSVFLCLCLIGCARPEEEPIWEKVKVGDLAPSGDKMPRAEFLNTVNLEVHVIEIPADNIAELDKIRKKLRIKPLRLKNYQAFSANSFLARFGQLNLWNEIRGMLNTADGQEIARVALMLPDGQHQTLAVTGLSHSRTVFYTAIDGSRQGANIGPGILGLRVKAAKIPGRIGVCDVVAYPVFSLPTSNTIAQLEARMKLREFPFTAAAFGLRMSPGDFVYLAPKEYVTDQTHLGGLFFSNVRGSLFFNRAKRKPPEHKTAVRVFLLACTRIDG